MRFCVIDVIVNYRVVYYERWKRFGRGFGFRMRLRSGCFVCVVTEIRGAFLVSILMVFFEVY